MEISLKTTFRTILQCTKTGETWLVIMWFWRIDGKCQSGCWRHRFQLQKVIPLPSTTFISILYTSSTYEPFFSSEHLQNDCPFNLFLTRNPTRFSDAKLDLVIWLLKCLSYKRARSRAGHLIVLERSSY